MDHIGICLLSASEALPPSAVSKNCISSEKLKNYNKRTSALVVSFTRMACVFYALDVRQNVEIHANFLFSVNCPLAKKSIQVSGNYQ